ncbi:MAG: pyridoxamine 5'-phosphate oxidase family protein [Deltaproteobacteria bacterium]|nr:pyridoxamine 5'-phosphate oxidase family protein [Deltaproteobacteria bacterium]
MTDVDRVSKMVREVLVNQNLAVLATHSSGQPYANLVAFLATKNLKEIVFATRCTTRKYMNIIKDARVALVIDTRLNEKTDFHKAMAVTLTGKAQEVGGEEREKLAGLYLEKFPHLIEFVSSSQCGIFKVAVTKYTVVSEFQNVVELEVIK